MTASLTTTIRRRTLRAIERVIQRLLDVERGLGFVEGLGVEAEADWDHLCTLETYLGYRRGKRFASPDGAAFDERRAY